MNFQERHNPKTTAKTVATKIPRIGITSDALNKMFTYVDECADEIGWMGSVQELGNNAYLINDVYLFTQEVHATTTEITPEGLSDFASEILELPDGVDIWNSIKMWGHSHVNMGVTPSGQDDKQMVEFGDIGHDYFIRLIANKKGEMVLDFYNYSLGVSFHDVPWESVLTDEEYKLQDEIDALYAQIDELRNAQLAQHTDVIKEEMKAKVSKKTYARTTTYERPAVVNQYGRHIDGVWTPWATGEYERYQLDGTDEKKTQAEAKKQTTGTTNSRGIGGTNNIIPYSQYIDEEEDYFVRDTEVVVELGHATLIDLSECAYTLKEYRDELELYGYFGMFTDDDVRRIMKVARTYKQ